MSAVVCSGAALYSRRLLPRLIAVSAGDLAAAEPELTKAVLARLSRALRAERSRRGHWTYDLNRHIALAQACSAEQAHLAGLLAGMTKTRAARQGH